MSSYAFNVYHLVGVLRGSLRPVRFEYHSVGDPDPLKQPRAPSLEFLFLEAGLCSGPEIFAIVLFCDRVIIPLVTLYNGVDRGMD